MSGCELHFPVITTLTCSTIISQLLVVLASEAVVRRTLSTDAVGDRLNLWQIFTENNLTVGNSTSSRHSVDIVRKLLWVEDGEEPHRVRHGKHRQHGSGSGSGGAGSSRRNQTSSPTLTRAQRSCYSGNEVLAIIAVTCVLNFAFVLIIMACVHYCTHTGTSYKAGRIYRTESLAGAVGGADSETDSVESRRSWERRNSLMSLHNLHHFPLYRYKTPSHSMEQLLFVD
ncbi:uncharacterized protein isoform X2 [Rhodnius prolixus]|uniref:uncharacterized protein isoform X2 n=1 Tax=Rhodnius prolixus TaxID=13249 RepID=UPI003D18E79E